MAGYAHIKKGNEKYGKSGMIQVVGDEQTIVNALANFLNGSADGSFRLLTKHHHIPAMKGREADMVWILRHKGRTRIMIRFH